LCHQGLDKPARYLALFAYAHVKNWHDPETVGAEGHPVRFLRNFRRTSAVAERVLVVGSECLENAAFARRTPATDIRIEVRKLSPQRLSNVAGTVDETLRDRAQCTILQRNDSDGPVGCCRLDRQGFGGRLVARKGQYGGREDGQKSTTRDQRIARVGGGGDDGCIRNPHGKGHGHA